MTNLARVLRRSERFDESERLAHESLAIIRAVFGERHELVSTNLALFGDIRDAAGRAQDAERYYRESLAAAQAGLSADHPRISVSQLILRRFLVRNGRHSEAVPFLEAAARAYSERYGAKHTRTARADAWLGAALGATGHPHRAESLLVHATTVYRAAGMLDEDVGREATGFLEALQDTAGASH